MSVEPFTFGIPLIARAAAADWGRIEALLGLTLRSLAAQSDRAFDVVLCGHDRPTFEPGLPVTFLQADWPVGAMRADNLDRGRKVQRINEAVLAAGGGLLMFVDADDWVDTRLVVTARATLVPGDLGGVIGTGFACDVGSGHALPIPHPDAFADGFDRLCGSSIVARLDPAAGDDLHRDPYRVLHEHYRFAECCAAIGARCRGLDVTGAYVVNTAANHSETHGPFADWRRAFNATVAAQGILCDDGFLARFGLTRDHVAGLAPSV